MMTSPLWERILALIMVDQAYQALACRIANMQKNIETYTEKKDFSHAQIDALHTTQQAIEKRIKDLEIQIDEISQQERHKQQQERAIVHHKAAESLKKELATLAQERMMYENELLIAWHEYDQAGAQYKTAQAQQHETQEEIYKAIEALEQEIATTEQQLATHKTAYLSQLQQLPEEWQKRYQEMRNKVDNPLVPLIQKSCSACFYQVLPQDLARLERNALLPCRNCYRYLYQDRKKKDDSNPTMHTQDHAKNHTT